MNIDTANETLPEEPFVSEDKGEQFLDAQRKAFATLQHRAKQIKKNVELLRSTNQLLEKENARLRDENRLKTKRLEELTKEVSALKFAFSLVNKGVENEG